MKCYLMAKNCFLTEVTLNLETIPYYLLHMVKLIQDFITVALN